MNLDIFDIGRIYFSYDDITTVKRRNKSIDQLFSGSYFLGAVDFFLKFLFFLLKGNKKFPVKDKDKTKVIFYGYSRNNRLTLEPIIKEMGEDNVMSFVYQKSFPNWKMYWYALPHLFELIKIIKKANKEQRLVLKMFFPKFWRLYGCPHVINEMLDLYEPKVVVMANDHQEFNRCLMQICNERGIETIYVQHASAGTKFPPLQFSYSLLDGKDAFNKYNEIGNMQGNIYLMGGVRFDVIKPSYYETPDKYVIGVAINVVDDPEIVKQTCKSLLKLKVNNGNPIVLLRPHPMMQEKEWISWCDHNGIAFSSPQKETSYEFIGKSSLIIANQSSIHLDTAMCHKLSIVYNMSGRPAEDIYLYKKNGLVNEFSTINEIQGFINESSTQKRASEPVRYFNCSYECPYEGKVSEIISHLIKAIISNDVSHFNEEYDFDSIEKNKDYIVYKHSLK